MKIALIFPQWLESKGVSSYFSKKISTFLPLGLAYLASIAEGLGHEVILIDAQANGMDEASVISTLKTFSPDLVGITGTSPFFDKSVSLAETIKSHIQTEIAIGGIHFTIMKQRAFSKCFDYGFVGEAEESWEEFLTGGNLSQIKGLVYRDNGDVIYTGDREYIKDLDLIPHPARHLLDMSKYYRGTLMGNQRFTSVMFSRGCPFQCIFCNNVTFGHTVRKRSAHDVIAEMVECYQTFKTKHFVFADDNLTLDREYIVEICRLLKQANIPITFEGGTRADLMDDDLVAIMKDAGLIRMGFGLETVNQRVRDIAKKKVPIGSYTKAAELCNKYGVEVVTSVVLGLPGETSGTIKETVEYLRNDRHVQEVTFNIVIPYPGTELLEMAQKGEHKLELIDTELSHYKRNVGVMNIGELTPKDLVIEQDKAYGYIYMAPWRIIPSLRRVGLAGLLLTYWRGFRWRFRSWHDRKA